MKAPEIIYILGRKVTPKTAQDSNLVSLLQINKQSPIMPQCSLDKSQFRSSGGVRVKIYSRQKKSVGYASVRLTREYLVGETFVVPE